MIAVFVELPTFHKYRSDYLCDEDFSALQSILMSDPESGSLMQHCGGLRKIRFADPGRGKGRRSGLRVIYYWWAQGNQFWLFTLYNKDEMDDLSHKQKLLLAGLLAKEINARCH